MKNQFKYLIILLSISLLFSCSKEEIIIDDKIILLSDKNLGDTIVVGSLINMILNNYNDTVYQGSRPFVASDTYNIDINKDGIDDFKFEVRNSVVPRTISFAFSSIESLTANSFVNGVIKIDTVFYNIESTSTINCGVVYDLFYSCRRLKPTDNIISLIPNQLKVTAFNNNEPINNSMVYQSGKFYLYKESYTKDPYVCDDKTNYINNCDLFPLNQIQYIGVRLIDGNGNMKLGWIKINHIDSRTILIMQSAIQQ